jgi:hypothetical protein
MTSIRSRCAIPAFLLRTFSLVVTIVCWVTPVHADQSQSFAWVADTRGTSTSDLVNTGVLDPIVKSILAMTPSPKVVIFGGDAAFTGGTANLTYFQSVFTDRLTAAGIPTAFAIGNHELFTADPLDPSVPSWLHELSRQQEFQKLINTGWIQNGPTPRSLKK